MWECLVQGPKFSGQHPPLHPKTAGTCQERPQTASASRSSDPESRQNPDESFISTHKGVNQHTWELIITQKL